MATPQSVLLVPFGPGVVEEPLGLLAAAAVLDERALVGPRLRHLGQVFVPLRRASRDFESQTPTFMRSP